MLFRSLTLVALSSLDTCIWRLLLCQARWLEVTVARIQLKLRQTNPTHVAPGWRGVRRFNIPRRNIFNRLKTLGWFGMLKRSLALSNRFDGETRSLSPAYPHLQSFRFKKASTLPLWNTTRTGRSTRQYFLISLFFSYSLASTPS